jgi:osmotically-inducible protein OsmY
MAERYDDRYRSEDWRRERGYGRDYDRDRGFVERAGDEVRSWFGDEEAERRRRMDEARYGRDWDRYGREPERYSREYGREPERYGRDYGREYGRDWDYGHRMGFDYGRPRERGWGEERSTTAPGWWNEPAYGGSAYTRMGSYGLGSFTGRGPRGYQRSDERVREEICERLTQDPWIDASDVEVSVRGGEVTLTGNVRDRGDKRHAEDLTERVSGVRDVHNNLRVAGGWEATPGREQTTTAATPTVGAASRR